MTFEHVFSINNGFTYSRFLSTSIFRRQSKNFFQCFCSDILSFHTILSIFLREKKSMKLLGRPSLDYQTIPAVIPSRILARLNDDHQPKKTSYSSLGFLYASNRIYYVLL